MSIKTLFNKWGHDFMKEFNHPDYDLLPMDERVHWIQLVRFLDDVSILSFSAVNETDKIGIELSIVGVKPELNVMGINTVPVVIGVNIKNNIVYLGISNKIKGEFEFIFNKLQNCEILAQDKFESLKLDDMIFQFIESN